MQYDEHKLVEYFADAPAGVGFSDLDLNNIPHHISCIMDGNGRWATSRGLARTEGHKAGIVSLREIITACVRLGVDVLSAYAFSTENWNRPQHEVNVLMHLPVEEGDLLVMAAPTFEERAEVTLREVTVTPHGRLAGQRLRDVPQGKHPFIVVMLKREGQTIIPDGDTLIYAGDEAVIATLAS